MMTPRHTGAIFPKNSAAIDPDQSFKSIFIFNTGRDGELMTASIDPKDKLVHYSWGRVDENQFKLQNDAASIEVYVRPGHSPAEVRRKLQEALDSLSN
jgi:hypothetical protein